MVPQKRAANLPLRMADIARKVCMSAGKDSVGDAAVVALMLRIFRERFAPGAIGSIFQDMAKLTRSKRADQNMDAFSLEFDTLRQRSEARKLTGSCPPDEFVSALRAQLHRTWMLRSRIGGNYPFFSGRDAFPLPVQPWPTCSPPHRCRRPPGATHGGPRERLETRAFASLGRKRRRSPSTAWTRSKSPMRSRRIPRKTRGLSDRAKLPPHR